MKNALFFALALAAVPLFSQTEKGASPVANPQSAYAHQHSTRAVVVGISDYQHKSIPDLQFADRDARAFAGWLATLPGGSLPQENVTLLLNENATAGRVVAALDGLAETAEEGGLTLIYFSGHGDIEKTTSRQNGYLLCHDAPATTYPAGGCVPLGYLQDIVSTISEKKGLVVLVTDACHAGKLAGSAINGTQTTNAALARQFANEVKIMSCQANELALEGEQWGGGRGVFSFHLVDGLTGLADQNGDGSVSLLELGRYLEDHVTAEAAPHPQTPVALGDRAFQLARTGSAVAGGTPKPPANIKKTEMRGFISAADSVAHNGFLAAIGRGDFLEPAGDCAELFYQKLAASPSAAPMLGLLRRNYAAALQDEIQQAINALLDNDPYEANNWYFHPEKYSRYPAYLDRAIQLLGEKHYMTASLKSKKAYFEGYEIAKTMVGAEGDPARRDSLRGAAKGKYLAGIGFDPDAAYLYFAIGDLYYLTSPYQTDSLLLWCKRAFEHSPGWVTPALEISNEYKSAQGQMDLAEKWMLEAVKVLPNSYLVQWRLSWLRAVQGRRDELVEICKKLIAEKPDLFNGYATLGGSIYIMDGDFPETERVLRQAVAIDPSLSSPVNPVLGVSICKMRRVNEGIEMLLSILGRADFAGRSEVIGYLTEAFGQKGDFEKAEQFAQRAVGENILPWYQTISLLNLGKIRVRQNRLPEAIILFEKSLAADPTPDAYFALDWAWLGDVARLQNRLAEAEAYFKKAIAYRSGSGWEEMYCLDEAHYLYGNFLLRQDRDTEAAAAFQKSLDMRKKGFWGEYGFALLAAKQGRKTEALDWLEKSLDNFYPDDKSILAEPLFSKIKKTKRFKAMMLKNFPPGWEEK